MSIHIGRIGLMRLYDFPYVSRTIDALADLVDGIVFLVDRDASMEAVGVAKGHAATMEIVTNPKPWHQGRSLATAFRSVAKFNPAWVFYPDEDEILPGPERIRQILSPLGEVIESPLCIRMATLFCVGSENDISLGAMGHSHGKIVSWHPMLGEDSTWVNEKGHSRKLCRPYGVKLVGAAYPYRHLCYVDEPSVARATRHHVKMYGRHKMRGVWPPPAIHRYDPELRTNQWQKMMRDTIGPK